MMKLHHHLKNESGIATLLMVVAGLVIVAIVGMNFIIEQQNKHSGSAVTVNAEQAQANAEAGYRYATKCLTGSDAGCRCNDVGANGCTDWPNMLAFAPVTLGSGNFTVTFNNLANCSIGITSVGTVNNTRRTINNILSRNAIGGAVGTVTVANPQAVLGPFIPLISVLNRQEAQELSNNNNTVTENNYVVPAGNNLVLVVLAGGTGNGNKLPTGVTFGGVPMILADQRQHGGGGNDRNGVAQYYLDVTAGQVGDIVVTYAGNNRNRTLVAVTLTNALSPPENTENDRERDDDIRDSITTLTTNAMVISTAYANRDQDAFAIGTGHIEITAPNTPNGEAEAGMGRRQAGAPGNVNNIGFDNNINNTRWVMALASYPHANRTISMNYTVPAGANQILVVVAGAEDGIAPVSAGGPLPTNATFNGIPMNLVNNRLVPLPAAAVFSAGLGMFWVAVNTGDTGTITATYADSSIDNKTLHAYTLNNATGPPERIVGNISTSSPNIIAPFTNTLTAGAMIASGGYQGENTFTAPLAPLPVAGTHVIPPGMLISAASSTGVMGNRPVLVAETPIDIGWNANFNRMALILASFAPSGGGGLCTNLP